LRHLDQAAAEAFGVLPSPALGTQLLLLADPQSCGVQLGDLEAEEILTLSPIAIGAAEPFELLGGRAVLGVERRHSRDRVLGVGEAIEQLELGRGWRRRWCSC